MSAIAIGVTQIGQPLLARWQAREAILAERRAQWARLSRTVGGERSLRRTIEAERRASAVLRDRLSDGATPALAASTLQLVLRSYAELSSVQVDRVDVAGRATRDRAGLVAIPVTMQAQGDVQGLVTFLFHVQHGGPLLVIDEISIGVGPARPNGERFLLWSVRAHGLQAPPPGRPA